MDKKEALSVIHDVQDRRKYEREKFTPSPVGILRIMDSNTGKLVQTIQGTRKERRRIKRDVERSSRRLLREANRNAK